MLKSLLIVSSIFLLSTFFTKECLATRSISISSDKSTLFGDEEMTVTSSLSGFTDGELIYIKGAFYQDGTTNYFSYTKYGDSWIKNGTSTTSQRQVKIGEWDGKLTVKSDFSDSGFKGEGGYKFKVGFYYTSSSGNLQSVTWSANILDVYINEPDPSPSPSPTPSPSPSPSPSPAKSPSPTPTLFPISIKSPSPLPKSSPQVLGENDESKSSTPSASPTPSPSPQEEGSKSNIKIAGLVSGTGLILIGVSFGLYLWYSKRLSKSTNENPPKDV